MAQTFQVNNCQPGPSSLLISPSQEKRSRLPPSSGFQLLSTPTFSPVRYRMNATRRPSSSSSWQSNTSAGRAKWARLHGALVIRGGKKLTYCHVCGRTQNKCWEQHVVGGKKPKCWHPLAAVDRREKTNCWCLAAC